MKVYVINEMQGFRAFVDGEGITIEQNSNVQLGINTRYVALLIRLTSECSSLEELYNELCYRLAWDFASVWKA